MESKVNKFNYTCSIPNFSLCTEKTGEKIISPTFKIGSKELSEWCLHIYPNGDKEESKEYVSVFLALLKPDKAKVKFSFSILNDKEEKKNTCTKDNINEIDKGGRCGFPKFVKKDLLMKKTDGLLFNDKLTILCEVEVIDLKSENNVNPETSISIKIPDSKLTADYGNLYDSSFFYDCIIKVENTEIQVHKAILAARSPVFCEILKDKSEASQTNIVEIKNFSTEIVRNMLKYIYTDEVSVIQEQANQIFEIANEYKLDRLKAFSEQSMCNSLTTDNVLERFALSDKYPTERLKECCEELILKNMNHLKETEEWEKLIVVRPKLLQSLLFKSISSKENNSEKKDKE
uniref:Speckle-type POZ protein-like (inferred by orthology to a human protein) n=1 Tax=Strongyloides venezuelensis TaxID=75913 RepID=A0A0K0FQ10_STRVS